jgi:hypothetical protein
MLECLVAQKSWMRRSFPIMRQSSDSTRALQDHPATEPMATRGAHQTASQVRTAELTFEADRRKIMFLTTQAGVIGVQESMLTLQHDDQPT